MSAGARVSVGECAWEQGYELRFVEGDRMSTDDVFPLPAALPQEEVDVSANLVAPVAAGTFRSKWRMFNTQGRDFGPSLTVIIVVPEPPTAQP